MKLELSQYHEVAAFPQFASDLDPATQEQLNRRVRLHELLKQSQYEPYESEEVIAVPFCRVKSYVDQINVEHVQAFKVQFLTHRKTAHSSVLKDNVHSGYELTHSANKHLYAIAEEFTNGFSL